MQDRQHDIEAINALFVLDEPDFNLPVNKHGDLPLQIAIEAGDDDLFEKLVAAGADINAKDATGSTPLGIAYQYDKSELFAKLLGMGADVNIPMYADGTTVLHCACRYGNSTDVEKIIQLGANVNVADKLGNTPLHITCTVNKPEASLLLIQAGADIHAMAIGRLTPLKIAREHSYESAGFILAKMLEDGLDVNKPLNDKDERALHIAAACGINKLIPYLLRKKADPREINTDFCNPLDLAVINKQAECVKALLKSKRYDISEMVNTENDSLLLLAADNNDTKSFKLLLYEGLDPLLANNNDITPIEIAINHGNNEMVNEALNYVADIDAPINKKGDTLLTIAIQSKQPEIVDTLLKNFASPTVGYNKPPISEAALVDDVSIIKKLLKAGVNINAQDKEGRTALHEAAAMNSACFNLLLANGADPHMQDKNGRAALHTAVAMGHYDVVNTLIQQGTNIRLPDNKGVTPLEIATQSAFPNITSVFLHKGQIAPQTVQNLSEYVNYTLGHKKDDNTAAIFKFHSAIYQELYDPSSPIFIALKNMPDSDKIKLMSALVANDQKYLQAIFKQSPFSDFLANHGYRADDVKYLVQHADASALNTETMWISPISSQIIDTLLRDQDSKQLSLEKRVELMTNVMSSIPDQQLSLNVKSKIAKSLSRDYKSVRVAYNNYLDPMMKARGMGRLEVASYKEMLKLDLTQSDFIMLSMAALQKFADNNPAINTMLNLAREQYAANNFHQAVYSINTIALNKEFGIDTSLAKLILDYSDKFKKTTIENYSRRFFETRLASMQIGMAVNLEAINRITGHFGLSIATNNNEAISRVVKLAELHEKKLLARCEELKSMSDLYQHRHPITKPGFQVKLDEQAGKLSDSIYSSNTGVMVSNQAGYADERSQFPLRNSPADIKGPHETGKYRSQFKRGAFVSDVSGHAFFLAAILEKYAIDHKAAPTLSADINQFIEAYKACYTSRGYHSLQEVQAVFDQPYMKKIFADLGVTLAPAYDAKALEAASRDTQDYTAALATRKLLHESLSKQPTAESIYKNGVTIAFKNAIQNKQIDVMAVEPDGTTVLHKIINAGLSAEKTNAMLNIAFQHGADAHINAFTNDDQSPLLDALKAGKREVMAILLKHGANIECRNKDFDTPLHIAAKNGDKAMVTFLLTHGADREYTNGKGFSAEDIARESGKIELATYIKQYTPEATTPSMHSMSDIAKLLSPTDARQALTNAKEKIDVEELKATSESSKPVTSPQAKSIEQVDEASSFKLRK